MKKQQVIFLVVVQIVFFALVYLLGAFNQVSFDISKWTQSSRDLTVMTAFMLECVIIPMCAMINFDKK